MKKILLFFGCAAMMLTSCSEFGWDPSQSGEKMPIKIGLLQTRANDTSYESGDEVGLYVVNNEGTSAGELVQSGNQVDNMRFTLSGEWTPDNTVYWKDPETKADLYAYYPYGKPEDVTAYPFAVNTDQSTAKGFWSSDFMWGKRTSVAPTLEAVNIETERLFSNALVYVEAGTGISASELAQADIEVAICNVKTSAVINLATGKATAVGEVGTITPWKVDGCYRAMVVPQRVTSETKLITVRVNDDYYSYSTNVTFVPNTKHKFTITVSKVSNTISLSIKHWNEDTKDYGGEATMENDETPSGSKSFSIEVSATACKAHLVVTPASSFTGYYYDNVVSAAKYAELGGTDNAFLAAYIEECTARFENYGYTWLDVVLDANQVDEWTKEGLEPETDYFVVAFGIDKNGNATTSLAKKAFTTGVAKSYDGWFGTWTASTPKSYNMYYDTAMDNLVQELADAPKSQPIYIQDAAVLLEDPQYAGYAFVWNLASSYFASTVEEGLAQWDSIYTVAEFSAEGELQLMNGYVYTSYQDGAGANVNVTWVSFCTITGSTSGMNLVNGTFAAHTFAPAVNGVSTSVPYKGGLSGGGSFEVVVYDLFPIWESGQYSYYVLEDAPTYFFYGPITLTKTSDEVVIVPEPAAVRSSVNKAQLKKVIENIKASKSVKSSGLQAKVRL